MPVLFVTVRKYSSQTYLYEIRFRIKLLLPYRICWKSNYHRRINFRNIWSILGL